MSEPLTRPDLILLAQIEEAISSRSPHRLRIEVNDDIVWEGVVRNWTREDGSFIRADEDVRDAYLWCSGIGERFIPVREVITRLRNGRAYLR